MMISWLWWLYCGSAMFLFVRNAYERAREWQSIGLAEYAQMAPPFHYQVIRHIRTGSCAQQVASVTAQFKSLPAQLLPIFWNWGPVVQHKSTESGVEIFGFIPSVYWLIYATLSSKDPAAFPPTILAWQYLLQGKQVKGGVCIALS